MSVNYSLVEHGVGKVVYQHLNADICRARVFFLLGSGVLLFPLGLALAVGQVALAYILHDILYGLAYRAFTYALTADEQIHKGGLVLYVIPVAESYAVQMGAECWKHGAGHGGLVVPRHILCKKFY